MSWVRFPSPAPVSRAMTRACRPTVELGAPRGGLPLVPVSRPHLGDFAPDDGAGPAVSRNLGWELDHERGQLEIVTNVDTRHGGFFHHKKVIRDVRPPETQGAASDAGCSSSFDLRRPGRLNRISSRMRASRPHFLGLAMTPYPGRRRIIETMPCAFRTLSCPRPSSVYSPYRTPPEARSWRMLSPIEFERQYNAKADGV